MDHVQKAYNNLKVRQKTNLPRGLSQGVLDTTLCDKVCQCLGR